MNKEQFRELNEIYGDEFVKKHCKWVNPSELIEFDQRARVKGDLQAKVNKYCGQFLKNKPQKAPISVVRQKSGYIVKDGVTRGRAKQNAHAFDPTQKVFISTFHHDVFGYGADQWEDFQDISNDHDGEEPNTEADMKAGVERRVKSGRLDKIVQDRNAGERIDYNENLVEYAKIGGKYFADYLYSNAGKTWVYFSNRIKRALKDSGSFVSKITTYTDINLQKLYTDLGGTAYAGLGGSFKDISNNERVFVLRSNGRIAPNLYGSLVQHVLNNPGAAFTVLISYDSVNSKEDDDIENDRVDAKNQISKAVTKFKDPPTVMVKYAKQIGSDNNGITETWSSKPKTIRRHALKTV